MPTEFLLYFFTGFATAAIGALPPGAVNLSVVYTTVNKGAKMAMPVILAAGLGEIVVAFFALHCTMAVQETIQGNQALQLVIALLLILAGIFLFRKREDNAPPAGNKKNNGFLKGLLLSILNPPVLVFWLVAFAYISTKTDVHVRMGLAELVLTFFAGVFAGKLFTLWLYAQLSKKIANRPGDIKTMVNQGVGILLLLIGGVQLIRLVIG